MADIAIRVRHVRFLTHLRYSAGKWISEEPRPQARAQEIAARGPAADEASGDPRGPGKRRPRARPPLLISEPPIENHRKVVWIIAHVESPIVIAPATETPRGERAHAVRAYVA